MKITLRDFLLQEFSAQLALDREEPREVPISEIKTPEDEMICEEDFFMELPPEVEENEIWQKVKQFYAKLNPLTFDNVSGIVMQIGDHALIVTGSDYGNRDFRITVNPW